ncbi:hypothetical protein CIK05_15860 [Bdellovibrio sp. qaytius]|nr:hypothetical protein CIK05_15860 [Bdellovibrio sp. qaytius]
MSTLRRRIKAEDIQYQLDDGKYFIFDTDPTATTTTTNVENRMFSTEAHRPSLKSDSSAAAEIAKNENAQGESVITAANRLLTDLKKAYTQVLQEKEEQIVSLKGEISDLRTLVRVLESENHRLNQKINPQLAGYNSNQNLDY